MNKKYCSFTINNEYFLIPVKSKHFKKKKNSFLFDKTLINNKSILNNGFDVSVFPENWFFAIKNSIENFILDKIKQYKKVNNFSLENYHNFVDDDLHKKIVDSFRAGYFGINGIDLKQLGLDYKILDEYINDTLKSNFNLSCVYKKWGFENKKFWIRIIRPNKKDNNPPHKDSHIRNFGTKDHINIYLPLAGSNEKSSLPLLPESHLDNENRYLISGSPCYVNDVKFTVPCIIQRNGGLNMVTPNPKQGEVLIFTPHIVHGGGMNRNDDTTRVSLEMRFFK